MAELKNNKFQNFSSLQFMRLGYELYNIGTKFQNFSSLQFMLF